MIEHYIKLAFNIDAHLSGYVDAYYGPPVWKSEAETEGLVALSELARRADHLAEQLPEMGWPEDRREYLHYQILAMQTSLRLLQGEAMSLADEVELVYGVKPEWVSEDQFLEAHKLLDDLLPPGDTLADLMAARRRAKSVSVEIARPMLKEILGELRARTHAHWELPAGESFEMLTVENEPWSAYNWYLGDYRSRIDVNIDLPLQIDGLASLMAHEGYPGHHTEGILKEAGLVRTQGRLEHSLAILNSPEQVISEGIATRALQLVTTKDERQAWKARLHQQAGLADIDWERDAELGAALGKIGRISTNVCFLLYDEGKSHDEAAAYIQRYRLSSEASARKSLEFLIHPLFRTYTFTYRHGGILLDQLFKAKGERHRWFGRLLQEPVTPAALRRWIAA
jgi:hypothetical protein